MRREEQSDETANVYDRINSKYPKSHIPTDHVIFHSPIAYRLQHERELKRLEDEKLKLFGLEEEKRRQVEVERKVLEEQHEEVHKKLKKSDR